MSDNIQFKTWYERFNRLSDDLYPGRYSREYVGELVETAKEVVALARQKNSLIVAHNYVYPELQEVAEAVGDSLGLSLLVAERTALRVDFCGVWFMGETVKMILSNRSKVYMPDRAGCSLVSAIDHQSIADWIAQYPDGVVVAYVNTGARTKAMSHYVCTSANAAQVLKHVTREYPGRRILFLPDKYLAAAALATTHLDAHLIDVYDGTCHVHAKIGKAVVEDALAQHPGAEVLIHPECACSAKMEKGVAPLHDGHFLSSEQMLRYATTSTATESIVATEKGLIYRLRKECGAKKFYPVSDATVCEYMKMNTLEKLCNSLRHDQFEVEVDHEASKRARGAIIRMLSIR